MREETGGTRAKPQVSLRSIKTPIAKGEDVVDGC